MDITFKLHDVTADSLREDVYHGLNPWDSENGRFTINPYYSTEDELIADHEYTLSFSIVTDYGQTPWTLPVPVQNATPNTNTINRLTLYLGPAPSHSIDAGWAMADNGSPVQVELETRIDGGQYRETWSGFSGLSAGYDTGFVNLHETTFGEYNGNPLLNAAHQFAYATAVSHTVEARIRIIEGGDWVYADSIVTPSLYSGYVPKLNYWEEKRFGGVSVQFPNMDIRIPDDYRYDFRVSIDGESPVVYASFTASTIETDWRFSQYYLRGIADEYFDGAIHLIALSVAIYHDGALLTTLTIADQQTRLPQLAQVTPNPLQNNGSVLSNSGNDLWVLTVIAPDIPAGSYVQVNLVINGESVSHTVQFHQPSGQLSLRDIPLTDGFKTLDLEYHYVIPETGKLSNSISQRLEVMIMAGAITNIVVSYRRVTNPFTRLQTGYEVLATGAINVSGLKVSASIDGAAHVDGAFEPLSPTMTKITGITIPRDGLSHAVEVKFWIHDSETNEDGEPLLIPAFPAVFDLEPPAVPTAVTATLLRDGDDAIPDQVQFAWTSPDPVDIYVVDALNGKRKVYSADANESSVILENNRRFGKQDGTAQSYKFGCAAFNRSVQSEIVYATPLTITAGSKEIVPPTPDEVAGTAEKLNQAQLVSALATELPSVDSATISSVINALITKIKSVVALGGSVSLNDLGQFAAKWSTDKISSTGLLVPAARSGLFLESDGFTKGTKLGRVMSDTEAALLK